MRATSLSRKCWHPWVPRTIENKFVPAIWVRECTRRAKPRQGERWTKTWSTDWPYAINNYMLSSNTRAGILRVLTDLFPMTQQASRSLWASMLLRPLSR